LHRSKTSYRLHARDVEELLEHSRGPLIRPCRPAIRQPKIRSPRDKDPVARTPEHESDQHPTLCVDDKVKRATSERPAEELQATAADVGRFNDLVEIAGDKGQERTSINGHPLAR
jgi:hypothetical protein